MWHAAADRVNSFTRRHWPRLPRGGATSPHEVGERLDVDAIVLRIGDGRTGTSRPDVFSIGNSGV